MLKIIITGANGLLGKSMISLLKKENVNFICLKTRIGSVKKDLLKIKEFSPDILFHFGALKANKFSTSDSKKELYESNVTLTKQLSEFCKENTIKIVYISTADLYERFGEPFLEIDNLSQSESTITGGYYGWTKFLGEDFIASQNENFLIFRASTIYEKANPMIYSCAQFLKNKDDLKKFIFNKKQYEMNFIRADFFAKAILKISQKKKTISKIYNFTSSFWINNFDIFNLCSKKFSVDSSYVKAEKFLEKRFNGSNSLIKKELGIEFQESNYLQDLKFYLASKVIGGN